MEYIEYAKKYGIGLTGGIATGKTTVARLIAAEGFTVIDADFLSRKAVAPRTPGLAQIVDKFGAQVLLEDGSLDRKKMAQLIFTNPDHKRTLEEIVHPAIQDLLVKHLEDLGITEQKKPWFYEASLLVETGAYQKFRELWCTYCSEREQIRRLMGREKIDLDAAQQIINSQLSQREKREKADVCINTEVPIDELGHKVRDALRSLPK